MRETVLKVARIGNSRGVRIPSPTLARYQISDSVIMEERADGIFLRSAGRAAGRLGWAETAKAIAASGESWAEWDAVLGDGLDAIPWGPAPAPTVSRKAKGRPRVRK